VTPRPRFGRIFSLSIGKLENFRVVGGSSLAGKSGGIESGRVVGGSCSPDRSEVTGKNNERERIRGSGYVAGGSSSADESEVEWEQLAGERTREDGDRLADSGSGPGEGGSKALLSGVAGTPVLVRPEGDHGTREGSPV
jgi:hypothetical protein